MTEKAQSELKIMEDQCLRPGFALAADIDFRSCRWNPRRIFSSAAGDSRLEAICQGRSLMDGNRLAGLPSFLIPPPCLRTTVVLAKVT